MNPSTRRGRGARRRTAGCIAALTAGLLLGGVGCGKKKQDDSPTGVVKQFLAASLRPETHKRHKALYKWLGPRTQARLRLSAQRATAATQGKRTYKPYEMLSASFRPSAKGNWAPKKFKTLSKSSSAARVQVRGEKKGQVQVVELVKVKGDWRIELPAGPQEPAARFPAPRPTPRPEPRPAMAGP